MAEKKIAKTGKTRKIRKTRKKMVKKPVNSMKSRKPIKTTKVEVKVADLEKLYLPVAIVLAGIFISCGLLFGLLYTGGLTNGAENYQCSAFEPLSRDCLKQHAKDTGLKFSKFEQCLNDQTHYDEITADVEALKEYGIEGTPQVVIGEMSDGKLRGFYAGGAQGYEYYQDVIEKIKTSGVDTVHEQFITENLGTVEELTKRYEDAYRTQFAGENLTENEISELSALAAESRFESYAIKDYSIDGSINLGDSAAPIVMLEYSDYDNCNYCQSFAQDTLPQLKQNYIDTGELYFVYKSLPLEETPAQGFRAANAAKCAFDQGKFLQFHNLLFGIE
ncbi:thioredoxin domain-containing protein [Candidatus Dojkabacteria bacterium]|nr:thioredoxin domain-containing protein [Candidatus Dojkabacteria bacterium]